MTSTKRWSGYAGLVWALAYIPIHIYWAFGGSAAFLGLARTNADFQIANWGASVVLLGAGLTAFALVRPWGRLLPRWGLLGTAWIGAVAGSLHFVAFTVVVVLRLTGVMAVPDYTPLLRGADLWNLLVFEPWFLFMGIFLAVAAIQHVRLFRGQPKPAGGRLARAVSAILVLGGLVVVLYGVYTFSPLTFLGYGPALMGVGLGVAIWAGLRRRDDRLGWEIAEV
ncbi:DUF3995 domain-containing protein [Fodinicola feengrottensis]